MFFKYDTLPQSYFKPERCLPVKFKDKLVGNDFEFASCTRLTQPTRYYYYDSIADILYQQCILKTSLAVDIIHNPTSFGKLLSRHESVYLSLSVKKTDKPYPEWRCIFPIKPGYYMLYNFEQAFITAMDLLMGRFGIDDYEIYYAKYRERSYSDEPREYILHFTKDSEEAQFIFYFSQMIGDSQENFDPARFKKVLDMRLLTYPTIRSFWTDRPHSYGQNLIVR